MFLPQLVGDQLSSLCISYGRTIAYKHVDALLSYVKLDMRLVPH
jgi:hypothetical protein